MVIHCSSCEASMRASHFYASTIAESRVKILFQWNAFGSPGGLGCCPFLGGGSVVFHVCLIALCVGILCLSLFCYELLCVHSSFAIALKKKRTLGALLVLSC